MSTITREFTKEQLIARINQVTAINKYRISRDPDADGLAMDNELARIALASLEADGAIANEGTITATQFKPVADLYGLTSPTGGETSFTFDAVEARDFIDGGWSCQEYVELERFQEAVSGNSPVIPDGWKLVPVDPTAEMLQSGISAHYERNQIQIHDRPAPGSMECAYVAMLAAAPQQEAQ